MCYRRSSVLKLRFSQGGLVLVHLFSNGFDGLESFLCIIVTIPNQKQTIVFLVPFSLFLGILVFLYLVRFGEVHFNTSQLFTLTFNIGNGFIVFLCSKCGVRTDNSYQQSSQNAFFLISDGCVICIIWSKIFHFHHFYSLLISWYN